MPHIQHPNIVTIHEIGECDGLSFFSMQYVQGNNLGRLLAAGLGPKSIAESASLIRTLADAVHYAHELNVLHLDLKPANVLIAESGHPFIADFWARTSAGSLARRHPSGRSLGHTELHGTGTSKPRAEAFPGN